MMLTALCRTVIRVVQNIYLFERKLSQYGYDAIHLQYRDILYDVMYCAITRLLKTQQ